MDIFSFNNNRYKTAKYGFGCKIRIEKMISLIGRGKKVLDVGCLDGTISNEISKMENDVYGIDASKDAIKIAKEHGVNAIVGNLEEKLEFNDKSFDVVFAGEIIEHIYNIDFLLKEIHRVLKDNGTFILSTPNLAALGRRILLLLNYNPHIEISYTDEAAGHIRYFVKDTLLEILKKNKFCVETLTSDVINLNSSGSLRLVRLAELMPTLGRCFIIKAKKISI